MKKLEMIFTSLLVTYMLGVLLAVVVFSGKGLWWILFAIFAGVSILMISYALIKDLKGID